MTKETASQGGASDAPKKGSGALGKYRDKRDPLVTPEPFDAERRGSSAPTLRGRFVVHLHHARRVHYDLRLEIGGTLKSFAVPQGPSLDPKHKRLAINTEDHPLAYLDFEDVIPEGNYGAGPMIAWDAGRVVYLEGSAQDGVARAKIDFQLFGRKLRGRFGLIHTGARKPGTSEANHWLLVKKPDGHARADDDVLTREPHSVLSGLTIEQLANMKEVVADLERQAASLGAPERELHARDISPMLCAQKGAELYDRDRYYELKLDGVRILAERDGEAIDLRYRKHRSATASYPEIARALRALPVQRVVLDGEIVAFDDDGRPNFQRLGSRIHLQRARDIERAIIDVPVTYMVFDLLQIGAFDLRTIPLRERKKLLRRLLPGRGLIRILDHIEEDGRPLLQFCEANDLEGIVAKRASAPYRLGPRRTTDWVKIKRQREMDLVIVGWEESEKRSRKLRSLVLASYDDEGELVLRGKAGSGLDDATIDLLLELMAPIERKTSPAKGSVTNHGKRHHVEPQLVANIEFLGFSDGGTLRFPVFRGLRADVSPEDCRVVPVAEQMSHAYKQRPVDNDSAVVRAADVVVRATLTNQDKVFWPGSGYTKGDLCDYYASTASALLPLLKDRPIILVRYPDGIEGKSFFQWRAPKGTPDWLRSFEIRGEPDEGKTSKRTFLIDDIDGLLHIANLGCIPIHMLASRTRTREHCDFLTVDFDLGRQPFRHAVTLALSLRELLQDLGLDGLPKTSGQTGLHVLVPLGPGVSFATARMLDEVLGRLLVARHPEIATMERVVEKRGDKIYVDTGQTGRSRAIVAPYSVRAVPGATVSTPLEWNELHLALDPSRFTIFSVPERLMEHPDPFARLLEVRPDIPAAVAKLGEKLAP